MDDPKKRNILYIVVVGAALALIAYFGVGYSPGGIVVSSEVPRPLATVEGEVLSIENHPNGNPPGRKEAVVKLTSGETVRAYVPPACAVFTGQMAVLSRFGESGANQAFYVLKEAREKE